MYVLCGNTGFWVWYKQTWYWRALDCERRVGFYLELVVYLLGGCCRTPRFIVQNLYVAV